MKIKIGKLQKKSGKNEKRKDVLMRFDVWGGSWKNNLKKFRNYIYLKKVKQKFTRIALREIYIYIYIYITKI